ncbi:hypothetical protein [Aeromicrobium sp. 179-A 4D2 NHS]|uniref:hypothetical protein n=1 Tax=Aeromicrobium sp. 179-A 4D2 NHS TaxID=3142375 RepID=UPI0039A3CBE7
MSEHRPRSLTVWWYTTPLGAEAGALRLGRLHAQGVLTVQEAVTVAWLRGSHAPRVKRARPAALRARHPGPGVGSLFAAVFRATRSPVDVADLSCRLAGTGIDREFLEEVLRHARVGTSELVAVSVGADPTAVTGPPTIGAIAFPPAGRWSVELTPDAPRIAAQVLEDLPLSGPARAALKRRAARRH